MVTSVIKNAYHVLGLETTAEEKEIIKRGKDILKIMNIGDIPSYSFDLYGDFRTQEVVNIAIQKLSSVRGKILECFFWFQSIDSIDEKALRLVYEGCYDEAVAIWKEAIANSEPIKTLFYKKNLSVLYLVLMSFGKRQFLEDSLNSWNSLMGSDIFWKAFYSICKTYVNKSVDQEAVDDLRKSVPEKLSDIYTDFYLHYQDNAYLFEFQNVFSAKGCKIEEEVLRPIYNDIDNCINRIESMDIRADKKFDILEKKEINELIDEINVNLKKIAGIGFYEDSVNKIVRDRVARTLRSVSVDLHNELDEKDLALHLLTIASDICSGNLAKDVFKKDQKIIKEHIAEDNKNPMKKCWFCDKIIKNQDYSVKDKMKKIAGIRHEHGSIVTSYNILEVTTPRCKNCAEYHNWNYSMHLIWGGLIGFVVGVFLLAEWGFIVWLIVSVFFAWIAKTISEGKSDGVIKPINYKKEFPVLKRLIDQGWCKR